MTPEDIDRMVVNLDAQGMVKATANLSEAERRKLSKPTNNLRNLIRRVWNAPDDQARARPLQSLEKRLGPHRTQSTLPTPSQLSDVVKLACLAVCPWSVVEHLHWSSSETDNGQADWITIVSQRKPDWADHWLANQCEGGQFAQIGWPSVRRLIAEGVCKRPATDDYVRLFAARVRWQWDANHEPRDPVEYLLANPDLLEYEVWRLFECETDAFEPERNWKGQKSWTAILIELSERGRVDRQRLLDATLRGLGSGLRDGFIRELVSFYEALNPTIEEVAARQADYSDLLACRSSRAASFALGAFKALDSAQRLDDAALALAIGPVLAGPTKGLAKAGLALLKRVVKRSPDVTPDAAEAMLSALQHESEDIHATAIHLLDSWSESMRRSTVERLASQRDDLAPTVRAAADGVLQKLGHRPATVDPPAEDLSRLAVDYRERASALSEGLAGPLGLTSAIAAFESGNMPTPLAFDIMDVPVLRLAKPIQPIADYDELIDAVAHAIEVVDDAIEVERILDAMARLADQRPADFTHRIAPLRKRCDSSHIDAAWGFGKGMEPMDSEPILKRLLGSWFGVEHGRVPAVWTNFVFPMGWLRKRCAEIATWVAEGASRPLLAAPTHAGGWLDPIALVHRMAELQARDLEPGPRDLSQALLRLTPDGRGEALPHAAALTGQAGGAVRWALGGDWESEPSLPQADRSVLLAAGRARLPRGRLHELADRANALSGPDGIEPSTYGWNPTLGTRQAPYSQKTFEVRSLSLKTTPPQSGRTGLLPMDLHTDAGDEPHAVATNSRWLIHWQCLMWPANPDPLLATGAKLMTARIEEKAMFLAPNDGYLGSLIDPDHPMSDLALLALAVGLLGVDTEVKTACMDALIEGIDDGRVHPDRLGPVFARMAAVPGWMKLNRLTTNLAEAARVSPLHAWAVAGCLAQVVAAWPEVPRDGHHALNLLLQTLTQLGLPLAEPARRPLEAVKGSSKTAKLAKNLLALAPEAPTADYQFAIQRAAEARLERAERWTSQPTGDGPRDPADAAAH